MRNINTCEILTSEGLQMEINVFERLRTECTIKFVTERLFKYTTSMWQKNIWCRKWMWQNDFLTQNVYVSEWVLTFMLRGTLECTLDVFKFCIMWASTIIQLPIRQKLLITTMNTYKLYTNGWSSNASIHSKFWHES